MLNISDKNFLFEIVADAVVQSHLNYPADENWRSRWINAIAKAAAVLEGDLTFLHWEPDLQILFYWSPESNEIYQAGESCQCPAYLQPVPQPCYHRAIRRIVKNYFEFQLRPGEILPIDFADVVFFDADLSAREKIDLLDSAILNCRLEFKTRVDFLKTQTA